MLIKLNEKRVLIWNCYAYFIHYLFLSFDCIFVQLCRFVNSEILDWLKAIRLGEDMEAFVVFWNEMKTENRWRGKRIVFNFIINDFRLVSFTFQLSWRNDRK